MAGKHVTRFGSGGPGPDRDDELPSEGLVPGAVQVPPDGTPVIFLADPP
jgi:allophanate hydrolase subunit 2